MLDRIKFFCKLKGITIAQFEREAGFSEHTVTRWGVTSPSIKKVQAAARYFGVTVSELLGETASTSASVDPEALALWDEYCALDESGRRAVRAVIGALSPKAAFRQEPKPTKTIPLLGQRFAAGRGEPDFGSMWEDYVVPADSRADFAIHISGNSMEPYLPDGSIALCRKGRPTDGDVAVLLVDGAFLVKQVCEDSFGNLYLFALNRNRKDADDTIRHDSGRDVRCLGTVILKKKIPLPK